MVLPELPACLDWRVCKIPKPKKPGESRKITIPNDELKAYQRALLQQLYRIPALRPTAFAHGFVPRRSTLTGVRRHSTDFKCFICVDVEDFFDNFPVDKIRSRLELAGIVGQDLDDIMTACTYRNTVPQGGPCSPFLTNVGMIDVDCIIASYVQSMGHTYSRYADDLTVGVRDTGEQIDCRRLKGTVVRFIDSVLHDHLGLRLNRAKSHVLIAGTPTGSTVNGICIRQDGRGYNAERKMRRMARAMNCNLFRKLQSQGGVPQDEDFSAWAKLVGYVRYMDGIRSGSLDSEARAADPEIQVDKWRYNMNVMERSDGSR